MMRNNRKLLWPFSGYNELNAWQTFIANGFETQVHGSVYDGKKLASTFPLGGIGTGYLGIGLAGNMTEVSIYNEYAPLLAWNREWFTLQDENVKVPLSRMDRHMWGHFPVYDLNALSGTISAELGIRAFSPFVPGDSRSSCMPAVGFEIRILNTSQTKKEFTVYLNFPPAVRVCCTCDLSVSVPSDIDPDKSKAILTLSIGAGEVFSFRAVFAWYAPNWRDSSRHLHRNFYSTIYKSAQKISESLLENFDTLLRRSMNWQSLIYSTDYPIWLKDALVQCMYSMAKNTVWLAKTRKDEWWDAETGWFCHSESHRGCPFTETIAVRHQGHFPILFFFPELEETALRAFRHYQNEDGEIATCFGTIIPWTMMVMVL
jgi:uncharacterized protein (DUF608 family)